MGNRFRGWNGKRTKGGVQRRRTAARCEDDTARRRAEGMVRRTTDAGKLHEAGDGGQMETGRDRRAVPLGHKDRE
eukprot:3438132-Heterocapsa_arctica.AAC.1